MIPTDEVKPIKIMMAALPIIQDFVKQSLARPVL